MRHLLVAMLFAAISLATSACGDDDANDQIDAFYFADAAPGTDAPPTTDAAPPADAAPCFGGTYTETSDDTNDANIFDNLAEPTGLCIAAGGDDIIIDGVIDPQYATDDLADGDFYEFTVGGTGPMDLRGYLVADAGDTATELWIDVFWPDGEDVYYVGGGLFADGGALMPLVNVDPGTYWVSASDVTGLAVGDEFSYRIYLTEYPLTCENATGDPDYTELQEGSGDPEHTNDVYQVSWPSEGSQEMAGGDADTAEDTMDVDEVNVLDGGDVLHLAGSFNSSVVDPGSPNSEYLDSDTYIIYTGAETDELRILLTWPGEGVADVDFILFPANGTEFLAKSTLIANDPPETMTLRVEPMTVYWLWVGEYDQSPAEVPLDYHFTICANSITWPATE